MKNALEQVRPNARHSPDAVGQLSEREVVSCKQLGVFEHHEDAINAVVAHESGNSSISDVLGNLNADMGALLGANAEGEAEEKS